MMAKIRNIADNEDGVTVVEFALVAPALLLIIMAILEVSLLLFAQSVLEGAAFHASRIGKTGYAAVDQTREETIIAGINQRTSALLDTDNIIIESLSYDQFNQIGEAEPFTDVNGNGVRDAGENYTDVNGNAQYDDDMGSNGIGTTSQIVVYTISYPWDVLTPIMRPFIGDDGIINLSARAVIQNEPF